METKYQFSPSQGAFLKAFREGRYRVEDRMRCGQPSVSLKDRMPPVYQQSARGTCVANAATALLEYYEDCKLRLSVQFLHEMTKTVERAWLDRNLKALEENQAVDAEFAARFPVQVAQIRLTTDANGAGSPAAKAFISAFARQLGEHFNFHSGSQIGRCFEAIREYGTCRYSLWPYANVQTDEDVSGAALPPGSAEDALKHRVLTGLYLLRSPNNVDEIRGILAGANGRRPMPVCVGLPLFEGCDGDRFAFPAVHEESGAFFSDNALKAVHEMLVVGYEDDRTAPGGGWFVVRNSWGSDWGEGGYGRVPYAYVECFCTEAGTILQDMVDYVGDDYGGVKRIPNAHPSALRPRTWSIGIFALVLSLAGLSLWLLSRPEAIDERAPAATTSESRPVTPEPPAVPKSPAGQEKPTEDAIAEERLRLEQEKRRIAHEAEIARLTAERAALLVEQAKLTAAKPPTVDTPLPPKLRIVARVDGKEILGAKMKTLDETVELPYVWEGRIFSGRSLGPYVVTFHDGNDSYHGEFRVVSVDWDGEKTIYVDLKRGEAPEEYKGAGRWF